VGAAQRGGFERLVGSVALNEVGMILGRELSRLVRTDKDFCHLLEVCQAFNTLIADEGQIYDLASMDDTLVLGIKGTLSVVELRTLKMRLLDGRRAKALRGELWQLLPPGYVHDAAGQIVKDPPSRVGTAGPMEQHPLCGRQRAEAVHPSDRERSAGKQRRDRLG
jgi:DNA invertase Pin-like site-specific DNA recombinase